MVHLVCGSGHCEPVYPHEFINVNTIFEVIRAHGGRTAWADKHPAYEILNGPSGEGVQDLYTPEVNSNDPIMLEDTTHGYCSIQRNDVLKAAEAGTFDFVLLDTRGAEAFAGGHIPGAWCFADSEIDHKAGLLPKDKELVTYCWGHD